MNQKMFIFRRILCPRYIDAGRDCADAHNPAFSGENGDKEGGRKETAEEGCEHQAPMEKGRWLTPLAAPGRYLDDETKVTSSRMSLNSR
jgi:hypothetical protein